MSIQQRPPAATTAMLIRKPVAKVFEAFIDPAITSKFWFTDGSGKLEKGKQVTWNWSMYNHTSFIDVTDIVKIRKLKLPGERKTQQEHVSYGPLNHILRAAVCKYCR